MPVVDEVAEVLAERKFSIWKRTVLTSLLLAENVETGGGSQGPPGLSAYEVAVDNGYTGTETEWLSSLVGADGTNGADGINGQDGQTGSDGLSAYEVAVTDGFVGTVEEWLLSLVGAQGEQGDTGEQGEPGTPADPLTVWPVGSIYWRNDNTNPATLFGGTWARYGQDRVLVSQGASFPNPGDTGGAASVTLTAAQSGVPAHTHVEQNNSATTGSLAGWAARDTSTNTPVATGYSTQANTAAPASQAHENMPPYIVAYAWVRTA